MYYWKQDISRAVRLTNQFADVKQTYETHEKMYETEVSQLPDIATRHNLMQQKPVDTLAHASGAMVSFALSVKEGKDEIRGMSGKFEEKP